MAFEKKEYTKEELIEKLNSLNFSDFTLFVHMRKNFDYVEKMTYIINKSAKKLKNEFQGFENAEDDYTHYIPAYERNVVFYGVMNAEQIKRSFVISGENDINVNVSYAKQIRIATLMLTYKGFTFELYADCRNTETKRNVYLKRMSFETKTKINKKGLDEISINMSLNKYFYFIYGLAEAAKYFNLDNLLKEVNVTKILARGIADVEA